MALDQNWTGRTRLVAVALVGVVAGTAFGLLLGTQPLRALWRRGNGTATRDVRELRRDAIARHTSSPVSPWAAGAAKAFEERYRPKLSAQGATLSGIDCRTSSCLLTIVWASAEEARHALADVLKIAPPFNCAREIQIDDATCKSGPCAVDAIFERCAEDVPGDKG